MGCLVFKEGMMKNKTKEQEKKIEYEKIRSYCDKASLGPWRMDSFKHGSGCNFVLTGEPGKEKLIADVPWKPDTIFIANARTDLPLLLDKCEKLEKVFKYAARYMENGEGEDARLLRAAIRECEK